jgi:putative membrane protein
MTGADHILPHLKAFHVAFMAVWMAGLLALPAMLARHDRGIGQADFHRIRQATHYGYVWAITPAAALAIGSGLVLIFLRDVFAPWMFAKLVLVAGLVTLHAWIGHTIVAVAETEGAHEPPRPLVPILVLCGLVAGVLALVLAKPDIGDPALPDWLRHPLGRDLPFAVPSP